MCQAINSKKILSKPYMSWRCLQAPGHWAEKYRDRQKAMQGYRSALVLPEQILGISGKDIYSVDLIKSSSFVSSSVTIIRKVSVGHSLSEFKSIDDIYEFEENYQDQTNVTIEVFSKGSSGGGLGFFDRSLFSSRKDAVKFATQYMERNIGKLC